MSPRLRQITEERSREAVAWCLGWLVVAVHSELIGIYIAWHGCAWGVVLGGVAALTLRASWKAFRRAEVHFVALEAATLRPTAWKQTSGEYSKPYVAGGERRKP